MSAYQKKKKEKEKVIEKNAEGIYGNTVKCH